MSIGSNAGDFSYLCRLCLGSDEEEMSDILPLAVKVELVTRLAVAAGDGLPSYICSHCKLELDSASDFINRCINNDSLLRTSHDEPCSDHPIIMKHEIIEDGIEEFYGADNNVEDNEDQDTNLIDRDDFEFQSIVPSNPEPDSNNFAEMFSVVNILEPPEDIIETDNNDDIDIADENVEENVLADIPIIEHKPRINAITMYTCNLCDESFNMKSYLNAHITTHREYVSAPSDVSGRLENISLASNLSEKFVVKATSEGSNPNKKKVNNTISLASNLSEKIVKKATSEESIPNKKKVIDKVKDVKKTQKLKVRPVNKPAVKTGVPAASSDIKRNVVPLNNKKSHKKSAKRSFPCFSCEKVFSKCKALLKHRLSHGTESMQETCPGANEREVRESSRSIKREVASKESRPITKRNLKQWPKSPIKTVSPSASAHMKKADKPLNEQKVAEIKSTRATFPCTTCKKVFSSNEVMLAHRLCHGKGATFACPTCDKVFSNKKSMSCHKASHRTAHSETASFSCVTCNQTFATNEKLLIHVRCHPRKSSASFPCNSCSKIFTDKKEMLIHSSLHLDKRVHKCAHCRRRFASKKSLKLHAKVHAKLVEFKCDQCGEEFGNRLHLFHHKRFHAEEKPYKCAECDEDFVDEVSLLHHFKVHANKPAFTCDKCTEEFEREDALVEHAKSHVIQPKKTSGSNGKTPVWTCDLCARKFGKKANLVLHLKYHKNNKCSKCGEEFDKKSQLATHMQFHDEDNPYKCAVCDDEFADEVAMFDHFKCHLVK